MRRIAAILAASALATLGTLAVSPAAAFAAAPAPECDSGASRYTCIGSSSGSTVWTITIHQSGFSNTVNLTTAGSFLNTGCSAHSFMEIYYTGTYQGVTQASDSTSISCNTGPWQ